MASLAWIVGAGGVAALYYSNRLVQLPLAIFGISLARLFGSALLAFVVLLYYARAKLNPDLNKAVVRSMFAYWLVSSVLMIMAQLAGIFNAMGWSTIVLHIGFLIWYGTYAFKE